MLNADNKQHTYVHAFFNYHVTVPPKKEIKELVDDYSSLAQFGFFLYTQKDHPCILVLTDQKDERC